MITSGANSMLKIFTIYKILINWGVLLSYALIAFFKSSIKSL